MEKGGKGYSPLNKGGSLKGNDDSATKSAKGRKVQFSNDGSFESISGSSPKSGGKAGSTLFKGGKGEKTANGGKSPLSKGPKPSEFGIDQELPDNVKCLMNCEAADIIQGIHERMVLLSKDPTIKIPVSFDKGLQYAKSNSHYTKPESVRHILEPLADIGVTDAELSVIGNVCPETVEEVYALIPSLKRNQRVSKDLPSFLFLYSLGCFLQLLVPCFHYCPSLAAVISGIIIVMAGSVSNFNSKRSTISGLLKDVVNELAKLKKPM